MRIWSQEHAAHHQANCYTSEHYTGILFSINASSVQYRAGPAVRETRFVTILHSSQEMKFQDMGPPLLTQNSLPGYMEIKGFSSLENLKRMTFDTTSDISVLVNTCVK